LAYAIVEYDGIEKLILIKLLDQLVQRAAGAKTNTQK
jgi:hypothetical protein